MSEQATKRPWTVSDRAFGEAKTDAGAKIVIRSANGLVAYACTIHEGACNAEANAHLIVTAVNAHDELVEALEALLNDAGRGDMMVILKAQEALARANRRIINA